MSCLLCHAETKPHFSYGPALGLPYGLVRCRSCRLVQTEPMPTLEFLADWYQRYDVLGERDPYYQSVQSADPWSTPEGFEVAYQFAIVKRALDRKSTRLNSSH